jgi:hypothetical protein
MNEDEHLAPEVLRFIGLCIPTVPHLEAMLLMWETTPRLWNAAEIAARIYVTEDAAGQILKDLERCGIAELDSIKPAFFKYSSASDWTATLPLVAHTYRRQLSKVARYIHAQGPKSVREFSRAFRLRRDQ